MSVEANKRLVRRLIEEDLNTGDPATSDEIIHPDFYDATNPPGMQHGIEGHKQIVALFHRAFPDQCWTITDMIAEGDKVAIQVRFEGTHLGDFFGMPPTHRHVSCTGIHIVRIADGKIIEHQGVNDDLGLMRQLGVIPEMAAAG
jgi:predicted ester cyclase